MIKAPFNFVPLSDKVYFPDWADKISHDVPFEDGESGIITLEITNVTPMFIRDGYAQGEETEWSSHVLDEKGNRHFFIPGTSLKGCFRSVFEILSYSKLNRYNNASFGYREFTSQIKGVNYNTDMKRVKNCGWLYYDGETYKIDECLQGIQKIPHGKIKAFFPDFNAGKDHETAEIKQRSMCNENLYPIISIEAGDVTYLENKQKKSVPAGKYKVVCTGYMKGKKVEYLFSNASKTIDVEKKVFESFDTVHKFTPYYAGKNGKNGFLRERLKKGERIPVFYEKDNTGVVIAMGITRMFKYPFKNSVQDCIKHITEDHISKKVDLSEAVFGYTSDNNLRGRVHFGNAFCCEEVNCEEEKEYILAQPHASYYPLYLKQENNVILNYSSDNVKIAGRKRYRISRDGKVWNQFGGNDNENVKCKFRPIPENHTFICKVRVHNLRKVEIGALLSSFTFNNTEGTFHNLGLAKSFGFGAFSCNVSISNEFKFNVSEYLSSFNGEISCFLQMNDKKLRNEENLNRLVEIASATHDEESMSQMSFEDCARYKEDANFSVLTETPKTFFFDIDERKAKEVVLGSKLLEKASEVESLPYEKSLEEIRKLRLKAIELGLEQIKEVIESKESLIECRRKNDEIEDARKKIIECGSLSYENGIQSLIELREKLMLFGDGEFEDDFKRELENVESEFERQIKEDVKNIKEIQKLEFLRDNYARFLSKMTLYDELDELIKQLKDGDKLKRGLSFLLEKRADKAELKIVDFTNGVKRVEDFFKKHKDYVLTEEDKSNFKDWMLAIVSLKNKDMKSMESKSWKLVSSRFGQDLAQQWFDEIVKG